MLKFDSPLSILMILISLSTSAAVAEPRFFAAAPSSEWTAERNAQGLWQYTREEPFEMTAVISVGRLKGPVELYLQGTLELWRTQGAITPVYDGSRLECLIRPVKGDPVFKWVEWSDDLVMVASFTFPVERLDEAVTSAAAFTTHLRLLPLPEFDPERLQRSAREILAAHRNDPEELADAIAVRREMASFRQDWEPLFAGAPHPLYAALLSYLEARYDAAFVAAHGAEMGMPPSLLDERLRSVENRKAEVLRLLPESEPAILQEPRP